MKKLLVILSCLIVAGCGVVPAENVAPMINEIERFCGEHGGVTQYRFKTDPHMVIITGVCANGFSLQRVVK